MAMMCQRGVTICPVRVGVRAQSDRVARAYVILQALSSQICFVATSFELLGLRHVFTFEK